MMKPLLCKAKLGEYVGYIWRKCEVPDCDIFLITKNSRVHQQAKNGELR